MSEVIIEYFREKCFLQNLPVCKNDVAVKKAYTIKDAIYYAADAWQSVTENVLNLSQISYGHLVTPMFLYCSDCFNKCGL